MKEWIKNNLLIFLLVLGIVFLFGSISLYGYEGSAKWIPELAKAMMGLSFTVIFGGIVKLIFDKYQEDKKREEKIKEFKAGTLNQLRKVFDSIDSARLLIEAHKSAKIYGDKMRDDIFPSIVPLYDIKRSLADSVNMMDKENIKQLRLNMHYMVAYLQALANEYKDEYLKISNMQFYEEEWKKQLRDKLIKQLIEDHKQAVFPEDFLAGIDIHESPVYAWKKIERLPLMGTFIIDNYDSLYRKLFVDFYEWSKRILKEQETNHYPEKFNPKYLAKLEEIDLKKSNGEITKNDSLVNLIINDLINSNKKILVK